jgi:hypothetical protein
MPNNVIRPVSAADVEHAIRLTGGSAYLYLGSSQDQGWVNAQLIDASPNFPKLVVYLVTGGFGWNLSSDDGAGEYFFVGIDLLDVLRSAGTLGQR